MAVLERMTPEELQELDLRRLELFLAQAMDVIAENGPKMMGAEEEYHAAAGKRAVLRAERDYLNLVKGSAQSLIKLQRDTS